MSVQSDEEMQENYLYQNRSNKVARRSMVQAPVTSVRGSLPTSGGARRQNLQPQQYRW